MLALVGVLFSVEEGFSRATDLYEIPRLVDIAVDYRFNRLVTGMLLEESSE